MLKITEVHGEHERTLVLEGKLVAPWLAELEKLWNEVVRSGGSGQLTVDLKDVIAISDEGEDLLLRMMTGGAAFHCCRGILTRHVVERLKRRRETQMGKTEVHG